MKPDTSIGNSVLLIRKLKLWSATVIFTLILLLIFIMIQSDLNATPLMDMGLTAIIHPFFLSGFALALYIILFILVLWVIYAHLEYRFAQKQYQLEQIINKRTEDFIIEKEKSEALLANILPKNTADEILAKGKATKTKFNFVTVLFSDIQGFTQIAEEMNPEVLIDELDKFFFHFDSVVEKYRIEKIKTIGDAYMCAGGIPEKNRTNPIEVILAALEMQQYMIRLKESSVLHGLKYWDIRIGIHTGTVIAGVVGHKKLSYDIWGDTVNTASRMETTGEAGKVNISGTTYEFVKDFFVCQHRGKMPVKYKGELDMYFVNGIQPDLRDAEGAPNKEFRLKIQMIKLQDVEEAVNKIFDEEAPPDLYFHNALLARNITGQTELLATAEKLPEEGHFCLKLASVFLLTGFISDYEKPAEGASALMEKILPRFGFEEDYIATAKQIIKNSFSGKYESAADRILHDARYDYLGHIDYIRLTDKLLRERNEHGLLTTPGTWIEIQKKFLADHEFLTSTGRLLRSVSVEEQIGSLRTFYT
ncbi:MAG: adenylate/guanylate cyclase domain-containing protein [Bacteroidota bacterium]|nr:adenylate/guanylate cyclase domain-containing protein [Bacteroidota bacterium]